MTRQGRIRRCVVWGCAVLTAVVAIAWIGSGWYCFMWEPPAMGCVAIQGGQLGIATPLWTSGAGDQSVVWFEPLNVKLRWWFRWGRWNHGRDIAVPLWVPTLILLIVTCCLWRADRRARRAATHGLCPTCGYNLAGLARAAACPECGGATVAA